MAFCIVKHPHSPHKRIRMASVLEARGHQTYRWFFVDGHSWRQKIMDPDAPAEGSQSQASAADTLPAKHPQALHAPMSARVLELGKNAIVGQEVAAGDVLVVLEAMKCEQRLIAPARARITQILCTPGTQVHDEQCLMTWHLLSDETDA